MNSTTIKLQCPTCQGVVSTSIEENMVSCGYCEEVLTVPHKLQSGVVIDDFVLLERIGHGGMGIVYLAHQLSLDRRCAIKILNDNYDEFQHKSDFVTEARQVAKLNHINIVKAYQVGVDNGVLFFAMEYIDGESLGELLRREKRLSQDTVVKIAIETTRALGYAWKEAGLVHRDIKPDNIMLDKDGCTKVLDLGLCRHSSDTKELSDTVNGTPHYISPEQIVGDELDIRSDFYSLGATMYQLLTGKFLFEGSADEMLDKHLKEDPKPLIEVLPNIFPRLNDLVLKLLAKDRENRYKSAQELENRLVEIQKHLSKLKKFSAIEIAALPKSSSTIKLEKKAVKSKKFLNYYLIGIGALIVLSLIIYFLIFHGKEDKTLKTTVNEPVPPSSVVVVEKPKVQVPVIKTPEKPVEVVKPYRQGLKYKYIERDNFRILSDLRADTPKSTGYVESPKIDLYTKASFFMYIYTGFIDVPENATYTFYLKANDFAILYIEGKEVLNIKASGTENFKVIPLTKGLHRIQLEYGQLEFGKNLEFKVSYPNFTKQAVPISWYKTIE